MDAPPVKCLQQVRIGRQHVKRQPGQTLPLRSGRNHQDSFKPASRMNRRIRIRRDRNVGLQSNQNRLIVNLRRDLVMRSEQPLQPLQIDDDRVCRCIFHARRKRTRAIEQSGMRGHFLCGRTPADRSVEEMFDFQFRHPQLDSRCKRRPVGRDHFQQRRVAIHDGDPFAKQIRLATNDRLDGKIRDED